MRRLLGSSDIPAVRFVTVDTTAAYVDTIAQPNATLTEVPAGLKGDDIDIFARYAAAYLDGDKAAVLDGALCPEHLKELIPKMATWVDPAIFRTENLGSWRAGAGNWRQIGRAMLWYAMAHDNPGRNIRSTIDRSLAAVMPEASAMGTRQCLRQFFGDSPDSAGSEVQVDVCGESPMVYIVGSLTGGTCGGMHLDLARYVRTKREDYVNMEIVGIFGVPHATDGGTDSEAALRANTAANLLELQDALSVQSKMKSIANYFPFHDLAVRELEVYPYTTRVSFVSTDTLTSVEAPYESGDLREIEAIIGDRVFFSLSCGLSDTIEAAAADVERTRAQSDAGRDAVAKLRGINTFGLATLEYPRWAIVRGACAALFARAHDDFSTDTQNHLQVNSTTASASLDEFRETVRNGLRDQLRKSNIELEKKQHDFMASVKAAVFDRNLETISRTSDKVLDAIFSGKFGEEKLTVEDAFGEACDLGWPKLLENAGRNLSDGQGFGDLLGRLFIGKLGKMGKRDLEEYVKMLGEEVAKSVAPKPPGPIKRPRLIKSDPLTVCALLQRKRSMAEQSAAVWSWFEDTVSRRCAEIVRHQVESLIFSHKGEFAEVGVSLVQGFLTSLDELKKSCLETQNLEACEVNGNTAKNCVIISRGDGKAVHDVRDDIHDLSLLAYKDAFNEDYRRVVEMVLLEVTRAEKVSFTSEGVVRALYRTVNAKLDATRLLDSDELWPSVIKNLPVAVRRGQPLLRVKPLPPAPARTPNCLLVWRSDGTVDSRRDTVTKECATQYRPFAGGYNTDFQFAESPLPNVIVVSTDVFDIEWKNVAWVKRSMARLFEYEATGMQPGATQISSFTDHRFLSAKRVRDVCEQIGLAPPSNLPVVGHQA